MVLNESELFTLHNPRLLMNTSILFWKIVLQSCGIFFNAISSKLEGGKPLNAKRLPSPQDAFPPSRPIPCPRRLLSPAPPQPPRPTCGQASASVSESARPCRGHTGLLPHPSFVFLICVKLKAGRSKLCGSRAWSSIWKATSHQARVPQELKRSVGVSLGVWLPEG